MQRSLTLLPPPKPPEMKAEPTGSPEITTVGTTELLVLWLRLCEEDVRAEEAIRSPVDAF